MSDPLDHWGSIWYHSKPLFVPSFLVGTFFAVSYGKTALVHATLLFSFSSNLIDYKSLRSNQIWVKYVNFGPDLERLTEIL